MPALSATWAKAAIATLSKMSGYMLFKKSNFSNFRIPLTYTSCSATPVFIQNISQLVMSLLTKDYDLLKGSRQKYMWLI